MQISGSVRLCDPLQGCGVGGMGRKVTQRHTAAAVAVSPAWVTRRPACVLQIAAGRQSTQGRHKPTHTHEHTACRALQPRMPIQPSCVRFHASTQRNAQRGCIPRQRIAQLVPGLMQQHRDTRAEYMPACVSTANPSPPMHASALTIGSRSEVGALPAHEQLATPNVSSE